MKFIIWKMGSVEHKLFPTDAAVAKLQDIIQKGLSQRRNTHFIWGADLEVVQTEDDSELAKHFILHYNEDGNEKLIPVAKEEVKS